MMYQLPAQSTEYSVPPLSKPVTQGWKKPDFSGEKIGFLGFNIKTRFWGMVFWF